MLRHIMATTITGYVGLHDKQHRSASRFLVSEMPEYAKAKWVQVEDDQLIQAEDGRMASEPPQHGLTLWF
jgi:hypothetical protein